MFFTGSHCSDIDVRVVFVTAGIPGVGDMEPSPVNIDEKFFTRVKNSQLSKQLPAFFYEKEQI